MATTKQITVITDTHGFPFADRTAMVDLGDNTESNSQFHLEPIHATLPIDSTVSENNRPMILMGNHDIEQKGKSAYISLYGNVSATGLIQRNYGDNVYGFGFDSATAQNTFEIPMEEIYDFATALKLLPTNTNCYILVFTHVPLFAGVSGQTCWNENPPTNTSLLIDVLTAYRDSGQVSVNGTTFTYSHSSGTHGYIVGCFSGHTHCGLRYRNASNGIYMEALPSTGGGTYTATSARTDAGLYSHVCNTIYISLTNKTVYVNNSDHTVFFNQSTAITNQVHPLDSNTYYGNHTIGLFKLYESSPYYPKFYETKDNSGNLNGKGIYLGYSKNAKGGSTDNAFADWNLGSNVTIYTPTGSVTAKKLLFGADGLLRFYKDSSGNTYVFPNNGAGHIYFDTNGMRWNFVDGKYQFDLSTSKQFKSTSIYYPVFDSRGYYIGWSESKNRPAVDRRSDTTSSRTWELDASGVTIYHNGTSVCVATKIVFDVTGKLASFTTSSGSYTSVSGTITFTSNGTTWKFVNYLFE